jgi:uncharacterized damage-inducible protein DinB
MLKELLTDTFAYIRPGAILDDLSADDATRRLDAAPHSIAEILGHLTFWQDWFLARCRGDAVPMAAAAAVGWPRVGASDWMALRDRFLTGLEAAVGIAEDTAAADRPLSPAIEFPPLARHTVHDALTHVAVHNAHHLGQIVTLRQLMGRWPPPSGSWTW